MKIWWLFLIWLILPDQFIRAQTRCFYTSPFLIATSDHKIIREYYSYNDKLGGPSEYFYDKNGLLYKKEFIRSDGFRTITSFEYLEDGRLKSSNRMLPDGREMIFSYAYDAAGHLISRVSGMGDSIVSNESYLYDTVGLLIKAVYRNMDGWLTGSAFFTHTTEKLLATGTYHGEDGSSAEIRFTYNPNGLLTEIRWLFSDGNFQVYSFQY